MRGATEDSLLVERRGATATLTINWPERRNAISYAMWRRLPVCWGWNEHGQTSPPANERFAVGRVEGS